MNRRGVDEIVDVLVDLGAASVIYILFGFSFWIFIAPKEQRQGAAHWKTQDNIVVEMPQELLEKIAENEYILTIGKNWVYCALFKK